MAGSGSGKDDGAHGRRGEAPEQSVDGREGRLPQPLQPVVGRVDLQHPGQCPGPHGDVPLEEALLAAASDVSWKWRLEKAVPFSGTRTPLTALWGTSRSPSPGRGRVVTVKVVAFARSLPGRPG